MEITKIEDIHSVRAGKTSMADDTTELIVNKEEEVVDVSVAARREELQENVDSKPAPLIAPTPGAAVSNVATTKQAPKAKEKVTHKAKKPSKKKDDKKSWPKVNYGDWSYVYITAGQFEGRYGYYDDHERSAIVYFGAPMVGDGPYSIPLKNLRKPPKNYCKDQLFSPM
jgi:hypothetical protein